MKSWIHQLMFWFGVPLLGGRSLAPSNGGTPNLSAKSISLFILLAAISAAAQQPATQPRDDSIRGHVVNEAGQPISGALVSLSVMGGTFGQRASTDSEGNFKIEGLEGGIYRIYLSASGYVTQTLNTSAPTYRTGDKAELTMIKGGVINGNVINIAGEPLVNVQVRAVRIRDADDKQLTATYFTQPKFTDDRGYYRFWALQPGTYVIAAGGPGQYYGAANPFANDAMTYAPASTRDTAAEIIVRSNQEVTVDVRYRGERGHSVSGKISGVLPPASYYTSVGLTDVQNRMFVANAGVTNMEKTFQLDGISDGDYEVVASGGGGPKDEILSSSPRRISVRGTDVTGLDLALAPMASIDAHLNLEADAKLNCGRRRDTASRETMITLLRTRAEEKSTKDKPSDQPDVSASTASSYENVANEKGDVRFRNLTPATYRFEVRLPAAGWYLRDLLIAKPGVNLARNGIGLKQGEKVGGITIAIAEGGASLRGRVTFSEEQSPPQNLRVYLVPTERENADNPLRFFQDAVAADTTFAIGNIAPGKYWLLAQAAERVDANTIRSPRIDNDYRAKLFKDAGALKNEITFKPCERTVDYEFRYPSAKP
jgi:protocatechuate 3,4-dioxygenase beta subunit